MNMAIEMPGAVERLVPTPHRVVIQPDLLLPMLDHPLVDDAIEKIVVGGEIVVASHEMDLLALDPRSIASCLFMRTEAEIPENPQCISRSNAFIDR